MKYHTVITDENDKVVLDEVKELFVHASPDNDADLKAHWTLIWKGSIWKIFQTFGPQIMSLMSKFGGSKL
jgi:hypothetical protein